IKLRFTPQIQHGARTLQAKTTEDQTGFLFQTERSIRTFANLSWEVTMPPNQYVVIGGRFDRTDTLRCGCCLRGDEARPVQRLLVMRASRGGTAPAEDSIASTDEVQPMKTPPLALQAAWTSARGSAN